MDGLNDAAKVVAQNLAECFVDLSSQCPTAQPLPKLRFDHVERGFDVRPLVVVL